MSSEPLIETPKTGSLRALWVTAAIVVVDQLTKLLVKGFSFPSLHLYHHGMPLGASIPVLGDFVRLTYIENPGMAFGIDLGGKLFVTVFTAAASVGILWYLVKIRSEKFLVQLPLAMILGGALGNLIDRVFYGVLFGEGALFQGKVVDFIDLDFFNISIFGFEITRWFIFNVADASVSIGVILLLFFHRHFTTQEEPASAHPVPDAPTPSVNESLPGTTQREAPRAD